MARKRKLDAAGITPQNDGAEDTPQESQPAMGGMWGGTAMNLLKERLKDTRDNIAQGVMSGTLALELEPSQIRDDVGSDRLSEWRAEPEFKALVENIKRRGQTQAIRVRPAENDWQPAADMPLQTSSQFVIQSGRRRLAACRELGIKVKAVVATDQGDQALADLEERFHENTMRKNLSGFEELLSVGLIADALGYLSQSEIADRLSVSQNDVSLGRSCMELHDQIVAQIDVNNTPKRAYREIIPRLRAGQGPTVKKPAGPKPIEAKKDGVKVRVKETNTGFSLGLKTDKKIDPQWLAEAVAKLVEDQ
ncbi:MAG: ParB N-terminal domain-containing protein [Sulfitobacter sp.]